MMNTLNLNSLHSKLSSIDSTITNQLVNVINFVNDNNKLTLCEEKYNVIACFFQLNIAPKSRLIRL